MISIRRDSTTTRTRPLTPSIVGLDAAAVRAADDDERSLLWTALVAELGHDEASRQWLAVFAQTDAPRTG